MLVQGSHQLLSQLLESLHKNKSPLFIHGTFGIGKSEAVQQYAMRKAAEAGLEFSENFNDVNNEKRFVLLKIVLHQFESAELKGIPFPNEDRSHTVYLPMGMLPEKGQGVIFFDELNLASPMLQSNAYQIILERRIGFYTVPENYHVLAAGNLQDDRGHTFEMAMPLNNRFGHYQLLVPSTEEWVRNYAMLNDVDHRVMNFLSFRKDYLYRFNPSQDSSEIAVPTPRTWKMASDAIQSTTMENEELLHALIGAHVGDGIATEFIAWLKLSQKYDIPALFRGENFEKPTEEDQVYSLISALVAHYFDSMSSKSNTKLAGRLFELSQIFNKEHQVMLLSVAKQKDPDYFKKVKSAVPQLFTKVAEELFKLLI